MSKAVTTLMTLNATPIVQQFKAFYQDILAIPLDDIEKVYSRNVVFKDPVHEIRGISELHAYLLHMCGNVSYGRFEYLDQLIDTGNAFIKWSMHFAHKRLGNKNICVRGVTHIHFTDVIHYHEDIYDMGEMLYDHLPILSSSTRWLKRRLSQS